MKNRSLNQILLLITIALLLGIAVAFFTGFLKVTPAYASGSVQVSTNGAQTVQIVSASTDDPLFHKDPGKDADVAHCRLRLEQRMRVRLVIQRGYPGYICTLSMTAHNRGDQAVRMADTQIQASPGLEVTQLHPASDGIIPAGQKSQRSFRVHILPQAPELAQLTFQIFEVYRLEETSLSTR